MWLNFCYLEMVFSGLGYIPLTVYLGWLFQRSSVCIQRKRLQLSLLWGKNAVEGQLLTSCKMICLHLLWACGKVKNFDWIDFNLVMFSYYLLPMTTISMLISLSIRIVSSEWIDQRELCGILMLANMIYMVFVCACIGINVQKGRNREKVSFSLACVIYFLLISLAALPLLVST